MFVNKGRKNQRFLNKKKDESESEAKFKYKCHRCQKYAGHMAKDCPLKKGDRPQDAGAAEDVSLGAFENVLAIDTALTVGKEGHGLRWSLDSGATSHFCKELDDISEISQGDTGKLNLANDNSTEIKGKGTATFVTKSSGKTARIQLNDALHVPDLRTNLLSVGKITESNYDVIFRKDAAVIVDQNGNVKMKAEKFEGLYFIHKDQQQTCKILSTTNNKAPKDIMTWHRRLGHLNFKDMLGAQRRGNLRGFDFTQTTKALECDVCIEGKMTRAPFPKKSERKTNILDVVHTDVCGPMRTESLSKSRYYVTFIDDSFRWCQIYFLKTKGEVLGKFVEFQKMVENQKGRKIKQLQSNNGTEYVNKEFENHLKKHGISRRLTVSHTSEQNGVA